jgi:hypothetical protein
MESPETCTRGRGLAGIHGEVFVRTKSVEYVCALAIAPADRRKRGVADVSKTFFIYLTNSKKQCTFARITKSIFEIENCAEFTGAILYRS